MPANDNGPEQARKSLLKQVYGMFHRNIPGKFSIATATRGQEISAEDYAYYGMVVPSLSLWPIDGVNAGYQMSEPVRCREDQEGRWRPTYHTFVRRGSRYFYEGQNFPHEIRSVIPGDVRKEREAGKNGP